MQTAHKRILLLLFSLLNYTFLCNANIYKSEEIYKFLNSKYTSSNFSLTKQTLVKDSKNNFDTNIILTFTPSNQNFKNNNRLVLFFNQDDFFELKDFYTKLIDYLDKNTNSLFQPITVALLYGQNQIHQKHNMIYGLDAFIDETNSNLDYTCIYSLFTQNQTFMIPNSSGNTAPSWLIKDTMLALENNQINYKKSFIQLSQIYNIKSFKDFDLDKFNVNMTGIKLYFNQEVEQENILYTLFQIIQSYNLENNKNFNQHFIIINILGHIFDISEDIIILITIFTVFIFLFFVFIISFVNHTLEFESWKSIRNIWFIIPCEFLISVLAFFISKIFIQIAAVNLIYSLKIILFAILYFQIAFLTIIGLFFWLNKSSLLINIKSIDFFILMGSVLNQFIFIFIDISIFPIFTFLTILAIFSLITKKKIHSIIIFVIMFICYLLYAYNVYENCQNELLWKKLNQVPELYFYLSIILMPLFLLQSKLLLFSYKKIINKKHVIISILSILVVINTCFIFYSNKQTRKIQVAQKKSNIILYEPTKASFVKVSSSTKTFFQDNLRTIDIEFLQPVEQCDIRLLSTDTSPPVQYSNDAYKTLNKNCIVFDIPNNPPQKISLNYGTNDNEILVITAIYANKKDNEKSTYYFSRIDYNMNKNNESK